MKENPNQGKVFEALEFSREVLGKNLTPSLSSKQGGQG